MNSVSSIIAYIVFVINNDADLSTLFIVLLPSLTIFGIELKFESSRTNSDTFRAASAPCATAIAQSACFNANTSFTPSPVIATMWFCFCNASISIFFPCGVTLPNILYFSAACVNCSFVRFVVSM